MITVILVMSAMWILAALAIFTDGHRARKNIDTILLETSEMPVRREPAMRDRYVSI